MEIPSYAFQSLGTDRNLMWRTNKMQNTIKTLIAFCIFSTVAGVARGNLITNPSVETETQAVTLAPSNFSPQVALGLQDGPLRDRRVPA